MTTTEIRIQGCLKNIEKTHNTLERHKARLEKKRLDCEKLGIQNPESFVRTSTTTDDQYWAVSEYKYVQDDINQNLKKLQELNKKLEDYRTKKAKEDKKADVPMIPAVEQFLQNWRVSADKYYREQVNKIHQWNTEYRVYYNQQMKELEDKYGYRVCCFDKEVEAEKEKRKIDYKYKGKYLSAHFTQDCLKLASYKADEFESRLNKLLDDEVVFKRIDLYHRCSAVAGVITDASGLYIASNGCINGFVVGDEGKAEVQTILAGGYAIQCLHYRVLVKPLK